MALFPRPQPVNEFSMFSVILPNEVVNGQECSGVI
jgi:hypothetical protein